ncbi:hypothetical protein [Streptomyces sp. MI02-7b]|uniref:hypothetical protein n=1 Tax=Streptomyces sp. MI02-7b TaxID=462941 RepID=UPI0029BC2B44|nr:hypothetical protein [Streptomyces sp. MI02-7b]MDX3072731.1 hypothetical protein [Streptomyces sp. MI02-7b]
MTSEPYCDIPVPVSVDWTAAPGEPVAECTLCREPTEYKARIPGTPLCPRCEWQEAQRTACSG